MTRRLLVLASFLFLVFIPCPAQDQQELVFNGGFEIPSLEGTRPEGWFATRLPDTAEFVEFAWSSDVKRSGERSVEIGIAPQHPGQQIAYNWGQRIHSFRVGKKYRLTGYIKTQNVSRSPVIVVQCWDEGLRNMIGFATTQGSFEITGSLDWTKVKIKFKVPEGTAVIILRAVLVAPDNGGGKVWFDDISVSQK